MNIKIYSFKLLASLVLILIANLTFAQTINQTIVRGTTTDYSYSVDTSSDPSSTPTDPTYNDQPDGTDGSSYEWSITYIGTGTGVIGTFPARGHNTITSDNKATINWALSTLGIYQVKVVETNDSCIDETVFFVEIIEPPLASGNVSWTSTNICKGGEVTFNVTGAIPNSTLHYSVTNATPATATGTVQVDADGKATINVVHDGSTNNQVDITLDKLVLNGVDISYTSPNPTATATVNIVQTSAIQELP
ncbi:MAG TPA: hypothetical protein K8W08_04765 [Empedobacter falsenii]|nr:hypothetical protein [Empedobacter falsenii]